MNNNYNNNNKSSSQRNNNNNNYSGLYIFGQVIDRTRRLVPKDNPTIQIVTYLIQTKEDRKFYVDDYNPDSFYDVMSDVCLPVYVKTYKRKNGEPAYNFQILKEDEFTRGERF